MIQLMGLAAEPRGSKYPTFKAQGPKSHSGLKAPTCEGAPKPAVGDSIIYQHFGYYRYSVWYQELKICLPHHGMGLVIV